MGGQSFGFKLRFDASQEAFNKNTCYVFNESTGMITNYLCYEGNSKEMPTITDVVIPSEINGVPVTSIGRKDGSLAYDYQDNNIRLIDNASDKKYVGKMIGKIILRGAFENKGLTSVVLSDTITEIKDSIHKL